jgi:glutaminase
MTETGGGTRFVSTGALPANGTVFAYGDAEDGFSIMSVSKPFVFALVCQAVGPEVARRRIGVNSTGLPFNSLAAIEQSPDGRTNPMVNSGAIATTSLVPGATAEAKWQLIHEGLSRFAGRELSVDTEMYECASETNDRNQSIARLLQSYERIYRDPSEAIDLYTRQCSLSVSASELATMGATLADGHWSSRPERDRRRNRHCLAGQGRFRCVRASARPRGIERQGSACGRVPLAAARHGSLRLGSRSGRSTAVTAACGLA